MTSAQLIAEIQKIEGDTPQAKLAFLNECQCCDRHQTNRPRTYAPWKDNQSNRMMWHESFVQCECTCRHMARWICRGCTDEYDETQNTLENSWVDPTTTGITENDM